MSVNIESLTKPQFKELPLVTEGESKEVRYAGNGEVVIALKPTIYSYTHNRTGVIPGSETLRLQAIQRILPVLGSAGLKHTYREVNDNWILSELVLQPQIEGEEAPYRPDDLSEQQLDALPKAPPIEVIGKARHTGTSKHRYFGFDAHPTRSGEVVKVEKEYPEPIIRFDWRNPMTHPETGERLADEILPEPMAEWFIDTKEARETASKTFKVLSDFFGEHGLDLWDICFFITEDGKKIFGEVSPDCMRVRSLGNVAMDKDIWRAGGSSELVLKKWQEFVKTLGEENEKICN